ncbi:FAD-dependent oxidoreductase [Kaistia algarum]|uniref:NAD(P)/FAD-dependent oxidoreductase n=1 Tax=Kaistia algarum TaxID=2083279 RepID=UPI000CE7DFDF|nr:FAD-dependent oxidoreductase [Kaistia algarum]MCX5516419.1 FAD-dependent oxidoreductase [Kaistia algarum]PPE77486.1 FAD-dependent oxidoreductase [Kaistia algarum]
MDRRQVDADIVVVGGGPAGCAAAIACAARGLRVILCEREPGQRDRPGETLHPGIEPLLAQLGLAERLKDVVGARHNGIWIEWGGPRRFEAFGGDESGPWYGLQVWRADFDALLLDRAREVGVVVYGNCAATGILKDDRGVVGITTAAGPISSRIVIDATGPTRWLGRVLEIAAAVRSPQLIARYGYREGSCPARDAAPLLVGNASGWTWSARVRPNTYQWTSIRFGERAIGEVPDELRGLAPLGPERGADVTWRLAERAAGAGWFLVGDAAATLDPTSSHGVLKALLSGMTAGHLIAASLSGKAPASETASAYHQWVAAMFVKDAERLSEFYRQIGADLALPAIENRRDRVS